MLQDDDSYLEDDGDDIITLPTEGTEFMSNVEDIASSKTHTVTFVIDGPRYVTYVEDGGQAVPPFQPGLNSSGAPFIGWDCSLSNVTSDMTVNAMY